MADRQIILNLFWSFLKGEEQVPATRSLENEGDITRSVSRVQATCSNNPAGIPVRPYPPVNCGTKKKYGPDAG